MRQKILVPLILLLISINVQAQKGKEAPPYKSDTVFVTGLIKRPMALTLKNTEGLLLKSVENYDMLNGKEEVTQHISSFKGMLLKDIIAKADVQMDHQEQGKYFVVLTATDGYQVIFSYDELMYGPAATGAYLATEIDGKGIDNGPFVVFTQNDKVSAPRHVKWMRSIEVRKI